MAFTVTPHQLIQFADTLEGQSLRTLHRLSPFGVTVLEGKLGFMPETQKKPRWQSLNRLEKVCQRFNQTGSYRPGDYTDLTFDASYVLTLIHKASRSLH